MTEEQKINNAFDQIKVLIRERRLKDALGGISMMLERCSDWNLQTSLNEIATSYNYMLQYMLKGTNDPEREKLYHHIILRMTEIAEQTRILLLDNASSSLFHLLRNKANRYAIPNNLMSTVKHLETIALDISINSLLPDKDKQNAIAQQYYQYEKDLFYQIWTNIAWSNDDVEAAEYFRNSPSIAATDFCLFIGATTLSLMQCFDPQKLIWLCNVYMQQTSAQVKQRAMIGLFFILNTYAKRIEYYPAVSERLLLLRDQPNFARDLLQCYIHFVYCHETEKITEIMNNEIVPGIIRDMNAQSSSKPKSEEEEEEMPHLLFPQIENKDLESKLERLTKLSMEGGDLYMSTFQHLKGFSFFHDLENWFKPFDMNQPVVLKLKNDPNDTDNSHSIILEFVRKAVYLCDNDKYSLVHMIPQLPMAQFKMMQEQLEQAEEEMKQEDERNGILTEDDRNYKLENNNYMHDLYRFFKLNPRKKEFDDLFGKDIFINENKYIFEWFSPANVMLLAEFLLKKKYWKEAEFLYSFLTEKENDQKKLGNLLSRLGYTYQKQKEYEEAIACYQKVSLFMDDDMWLKEQMATCLRLVMNYTDALTYYQEIELAQPNKISILFNLGICLAELKRYDEALKYFFKIDFIQANNVKTWRAIAWYSFVADKLEQAQTYYQKITDSEPMAANDLLNSGHVQWVMGNRKKALVYYRSAKDAFANQEDFLAAFNKDKELLVRKGIDESTIPLMLDLI
jgi:tetratricopeptide (TPR) repeat protein